MARYLVDSRVNRIFRGSLPGAIVGVVLVALGCHDEAGTEPPNPKEQATFQLVRPQVRTLVRVVGQPSFVESYERTSIYPKMTAYIDKWIVDIGDTVQRGDLLATLFVPELVEDFGTKKATVILDKERISLAEQQVDVAAADVEAAEARLEEAEAILADYQAQVDRWDLQVKRLDRETTRGVVDPQILTESKYQLKSTIASRNKAQATISKARAQLLSDKAALAEAKVNVAVAKADLTVAESEAKRLEAWVGYLNLYAPFDGIIVARNANTGDFVLPASGDPTAMSRAPHLSPEGSAPIYVVDRLDVVRVFVDVPEADANNVREGVKATVLIRAYRDEEIDAEVTRCSWGLNVTSRTLRAEIDLRNPNAEIRPGMYAYAKVIIKREEVPSLPIEALDHQGDQTFCWLYEDGQAKRTEVETGITDGKRIEVTRHRLLDQEAQEERPRAWTRFDLSEQVILGDLTTLSNGKRVQVEDDHSYGTENKTAEADGSRE